MLPPALLLLLASCAPPAPALHVDNARIVPAGASAAAYLDLANDGGADRLVAVEAPGIGEASLHSTTMEGGIMRMRPLPDGLAVGGGATVKLAPMGTHIMIEGLSRRLVVGEHVPLVLKFERQGEVRTEALVGSTGAAH